MKSAAIFPFDKSSVCLARYKHLIKQYDLQYFISPKGRALDKKDIAAIDGGVKTNLCITEDFEHAISEVDTVIFLEGSEPVKTDIYLSHIKLAHELGKEIVIDGALQNSFETIAATKVLVPNVEVETTDLDYKESRLLYHDIPIIAVFGIGESCNKFEIQLALKEAFESRGHSVLQFAPKSYAELFGIKRLPEFLFDSSIPLQTRIIRLNHYIYQEVLNAKADVMIIGVPGGVISLDDYFHNEFSELPYIISNAIKPDIAILSAYFFPKINQDFLLECREYMKYKFGAIVDYFHISNNSYTIDNTDEVPEVIYLSTSWESVDQTICDMQVDNIKVFNVYGPTNATTMNAIYEELSSNIDVV